MENLSISSKHTIKYSSRRSNLRKVQISEHAILMCKNWKNIMLLYDFVQVRNFSLVTKIFVLRRSSSFFFKLCVLVQI